MTPIALDYTSRIPPAALKAAGAVAVCRYLSRPDLAWKTIKRPEFDELNAAGIAVTLNWEAANDDWLRGGPGGMVDGATTVNAAEALNAPKGQVIIFSADFNMSRAQYVDFGRAYARNAAAFCNSAGFRPGVYGPYDVLQWVRDDGIMDAFWQAGMSTSWDNGRNANRWPGAHLRQRGHMMVGGTDTDWSEILIQPLWGTPARKGKTMRIAALTDPSGAKAWMKGDGIFHTPIMTWPEHQQEIADGAIERQFKDTDDWQAFVGRTPAEGIAPGGTSGGLTQEQINAGIAANVDGFGASLASHIKIV